MIVRPYEPADLQQLRRIHAQSGLDYRFPDLTSPLFVSRLVCEREGLPRTFLGAKLQAEVYLISDGSPKSKWEDIQVLDAALRDDLFYQGVDDQFCAVPVAVDRYFSRRMAALGWQKARPDWILWTRDTKV